MSDTQPTDQSNSEVESRKAKYEKSLPGSPLREGEILSNVIQLRLDLETISSEEPFFTPTIHPFVIIVSQDCDLDWDYNARQTTDVENIKSQNKLVPNLLFCMVTEARNLRDRDKRFPKNIPQEINSTVWNQIRINKHERYHFLESLSPHEDLIMEGLPELGVDFKRYFTLDTDEIYKRIEIGEAQRRCRLVSPYLEHFISRFYYFQSRIALPEDHYSEPDSKK